MCPFFMAVVCSFAEHTGAPPEIVFGFLYAVGGWCTHKEFHACLDPRRPDRRSRPRCYAQVIGDVNMGKSPMFDDYFNPFMMMVGSPLQNLFADGGKKGLRLAKATSAEFGQRMKDSDGMSFWATPENLLALDCPWAMGKTNDKNPGKIDFGECLETQNGLDFGPTSTKGAAEQVHVARTNLGLLHLGQPRSIHDYWGQAFEAKSAIRGVGYETRPWFLFAGRVSEGDADAPTVTATASAAFLRLLWICIACCIGHRQGHKGLGTPMLWYPTPSLG